MELPAFLRLDAAAHLPTLSQESHRAANLPFGITPVIVGLVVGVVAAILGFAVFAAIVTRKPPRRGVLVVHPYATLEAARQTPPPSPVFSPTGSAVDGSWPGAGPPRAPFTPSTALSARVLAKMGIPVGPFGEHLSPTNVVEVGTHADEDELSDHDLLAAEPAQTNTQIMESRPLSRSPSVPASVAPVSVAPVVVVGAVSASVSSGIPAPGPTPHPRGIIRSSPPSIGGTRPSGVGHVESSGVVKAASIADLSFDDGATQIGEPFFDETPKQPRVVVVDPERPKIRPTKPQPPRFPAAPATPPDDAPKTLARATPPPFKAQTARYS